MLSGEKSIAKPCVKNNTASRCAAAGGRKFQGTRLGTKGPFSGSGEVLRRACGGVGIRKASEGIYKKEKQFREDLLGHGDRKAEVLLVCFWRMFSSFLRYLSVHRQKPEPGMQASWALAWPCSKPMEMPRAEDVPRVCPPLFALEALGSPHL